MKRKCEEQREELEALVVAWKRLHGGGEWKTLIGLEVGCDVTLKWWWNEVHGEMKLWKKRDIMTERRSW